MLFSKLPFQKKLLIGIVLGCLVPYIAGAQLIKNITSDWIYDNYTDNTLALLHETANHVDENLVQSSKNLIQMIASDKRILDSKDELRSYVTYESGQRMNEPTPAEKEIEDFFKGIKESHDMVTLVSFGTENGGYVEYPPFKPSKSYDPRARDWYISAMKQEGPVLTEPYQTKVSKDLIVSVDQSIYENGNKIGVVSVSISLGNIMKTISKDGNYHSGAITILSANDTFINSPLDQSWLMRSVSDLNFSAYQDIAKQDGKSFEAMLDGKMKLFTVHISPVSGWKYVSVIDKSIVDQHIKSIVAVIIGVFIMTLLIIVFMLMFVTRRITEPIGAIAKVINQMEAYNLDEVDRQYLNTYSERKDEIGEITRAIDGMFMRVHDHVKQIRLYMEEISYKNDLLVASEEELRTQLEEIESQKSIIHFLADHDPLTNLPNRRLFNEKLEEVIYRGGKGAVLMLDLDNFKVINDTLGHLYGDKLLEELSRRMVELADENLFISRFGGDEFLMFYEMKGNEDCCKVTFGNETNTMLSNLVNQLYDLVSDTLRIDNLEVKVEFSIGISLFPLDSRDITELIMYADLALYQAKSNGKKYFVYYDKTMAENLMDKQNIKKILHEALEDDGFKMVYQPQIEVVTGKIKGYEALVRLKHHTVSPGKFIAIAEEDSMIIDIGRKVTQLVIHQMGEWQQCGMALLPISINFSAAQLQDTGYPNFLMDLLEKHQVAPKNIVIEITESLFLKSKTQAVAYFSDLKTRGIQVAIDDFGTGYSSMSYLTQLPIDIIKIDRTLCFKFLEMNNTQFIESLIKLVHSLNLVVVAEGIESMAHAEVLAQADCDIIQGYCYSHPLEAHEVVDPSKISFLIECEENEVSS